MPKNKNKCNSIEREYKIEFYSIYFFLSNSKNEPSGRKRSTRLSRIMRARSATHRVARPTKTSTAFVRANINATIKATIAFCANSH